MESAVERVITTMWDRYHEPLTLAEMADTAIFSRFYFSRIFRSVTGTSPGRFLTAIRLYKAKNLLLQTSASVTEVSYLVGYNSPGTFSSRFTRSIGMSPGQFRELSRVGIAAPSALPMSGGRHGIVHGWLSAPPTGRAMRTYVGAFESNIPEGLPRSCVTLDSAGPFQLTGLSDGKYFVHAVAVARHELDPRPWARRPMFVASSQAIQVIGGRPGRVDVKLRPSRLIDLPVLIALPELDSRRVPAAALVADRVG
ncbi:MAG: helix-turn-helix transcriptional regulator [Jatrophihabitantaceae bacterium]